MSTARVFLFARPMDDRDRDERLALLGVTESPHIPHHIPAATEAELDKRRAEHEADLIVAAALAGHNGIGCMDGFLCEEMAVWAPPDKPTKPSRFARRARVLWRRMVRFMTAPQLFE